MKILDRIPLRAPLKHLALACAVALGLGTGTTRAGVIDISGLGINIDALVGAGNTGRLTGATSCNSGFTVPLDLNGNTLTLYGGWSNNGAISGSGVLHFVGGGGISGDVGNTYTGTTTVSGDWNIIKTSGNALCGDISVLANSTLHYGQWNYWTRADNQIADDANVTLTSTSALMLYAYYAYPDERTGPKWPVASDTIGELHVVTGSQVNTGSGRMGTPEGGVLSVSELYIDGVRQNHGTITGPVTFAGLVITGTGSVVVRGGAPGTATTTVVTTSGSPSTEGVSVTLTATVTPYPTGGTVQFYDNTVAIGAAATVNTSTGIATLVTSDLIPGSHTITATYSGTPGFLTSTDVTGASQTVNEVTKVPTTTVVTTSGSPTMSGDSVTLTATVTPHPTTGSGGTVRFYDNTVAIGAAASVNTGTGEATLATTALTVGSHTITATYSGAIGYATSTDPTGATQIVNGRVIDIQGLGINIDALVGAGNTGRLIGPTSSNGGFTVPLDLHGNTLTLNTWNNNGAISGNGAVHFAGTGGIQGDSAPSTYTGETTVSGYLVLWKSQGNALCGNITLADNTEIRTYLSNQIADNANLTLAATSQLSLFNYYTPQIALTETIAGLTLVDGAKVNTGTGTPTGSVLTVSSLTVDGVVQPAGTYTSSSAFVIGTGSIVVPPGGAQTPYELWAASLPGDKSPSGDSNNDGVSNGVAFFMGKDGPATNPGVVNGKVTWPHVGVVTSFEVQVSDNLQDWSAATTGVDTSDSTKVVYTLPTGAAKKFCRLLVIP